MDLSDEHILAVRCGLPTLTIYMKSALAREDDKLIATQGLVKEFRRSLAG